MMKTYSQMSVLASILEHHPILWEKLHPHVPKVSQVFLELMVADITRSLSKEAGDKAISKQLLEAGYQIIEAASSSLRSAWEEGGICPDPWPWPFPSPWPWPFPVPVPGPWPGPDPRSVAKLGFDEKTFVINSLKLLSEITKVQDAGKMIQDAANQLQGIR